MNKIMDSIDPGDKDLSFLIARALWALNVRCGLEAAYALEEILGMPEFRLSKDSVASTKYQNIMGQLISAGSNSRFILKVIAAKRGAPITKVQQFLDEYQITDRG